VGSNPTGAWIFVCCECRVLSGRGLCDELIARPEESYRLWCVVVCDLETSRISAPYIYDISSLRVNGDEHVDSVIIMNYFVRVFRYILGVILKLLVNLKQDIFIYSGNTLCPINRL